MLIGLGCMSFYHDLKSSQHSFVDLKWQTLRNIPKENLKKAISLPLSLGLWNGRNYSRNWAISSRHQSDLRLLQELARAGSPSDLTILPSITDIDQFWSMIDWFDETLPSSGYFEVLIY